MTRFLNGFLQSTLTATALFFTLLLLRRILGQRFTGRGRAALWTIPLLVLLLPIGISLPQSAALREAKPVVEYRQMVQTLQAPAVPPQRPVQPKPSTPAGQQGVPPVTSDNPTAQNDTPSQKPAAQAPVQNTPSPQASDNAAVTETAAAPIAWQSLLPWVWGVGAAGVLLIQLLRHALFLRSVKKRRREADTETHRVFSTLRQQLGIRRSIALYTNDAVHSPFLTGIFRPTLYLPQDTPEEALYYVFMHELTHYKRGDLLLQWLALLANALHFFNPVAWLLRRAVRLDCELACDETVLLRLAQPQYKEYGKVVIQMLKPKQPAPALSTAMSGSKRAVFRRVREIGRFRRSRHSALYAALSLLLVIGVCVSALSACQPGTETTPVVEPILANYNKGKEMSLNLKELETLESFIARMSESVTYPSPFPERNTQVMLQAAIASNISHNEAGDDSDGSKEFIDNRMRDYFGKLPEQPAPNEADAPRESIFLTAAGKYGWSVPEVPLLARVKILKTYDLGNDHYGFELANEDWWDGDHNPAIAVHCILKKTADSPLGYHMIAMAPAEPQENDGRRLHDTFDSAEREKLESFVRRMAAVACTDPETQSEYQEGKSKGNEIAAMLSYGLLHTQPLADDATRYDVQAVNQTIRDYFGVLPGDLPAGLLVQKDGAHYRAENLPKYTLEPEPPEEREERFYIFDLGNNLLSFSTGAKLLKDGKYIANAAMSCIVLRDDSAPLGYYLKYFGSYLYADNAAYEGIDPMYYDGFDHEMVRDLSHQFSQRPDSFCRRLGELPLGYDKWEDMWDASQETSAFRYDQLEIGLFNYGEIGQFTVTYEGKPNKAAYNYRGVDGNDNRESILKKLGQPDSDSNNELTYLTKDYRGNGETIRFRLNDAGQLAGFVYSLERKPEENGGENAPKEETLEAFITRMGYSAVKAVNPLLAERRKLEGVISRMGGVKLYPNEDPARNTQLMLTAARDAAIMHEGNEEIKGGCPQTMLNDRVRDYFGKLPAQPAPQKTDADSEVIYQEESNRYGWGGGDAAYTAWVKLTKVYDLGNGYYATESVSESADTENYTDSAAAHCILQKTDQGSLGYYMIAMDSAVLPDMDGVKGTDYEKYAAKLTQDLAQRLNQDVANFCRRLGKLPQHSSDFETLAAQPYQEPDPSVYRYDQLDVIFTMDSIQGFIVSYEGKPDKTFVNYRGLDGNANRQRIIDTLGQPSSSSATELTYRTTGFRREAATIRFRLDSAGQLAGFVYAADSISTLPEIQNF